MSGGHFDYIQHRIRYEAIDALKKYTEDYKAAPNTFDHSEKILDDCERCINQLELSIILLDELDLLIEGDTSEERYQERLAEKLSRYNNKKAL